MKKIAHEDEPARFTAEQLAKSRRFRDRQDLVRAVLGDSVYSVEEAEEEIRKYLKGKVS